MSGHSHFSSIKHKKEITDKKRGQIFSKITRMITVAAKEGGDDPTANSKLRLVIEKARSFNMPSDNIKKAIKRGTGELKGIKLESILVEAYGPGGIAIIIEGITDNKNRTLSELRQILTQNNGKLVGEGSVRWLFERKGVIVIDYKLQTEDFQDREKLGLLAIEGGAEDIFWHNDTLDVYTKTEDLEKVKTNLEDQGIKIESASLDWVAKEMIQVEKKEKEVCQKLFEALDENEAVQDIYSNLKT